MIEDPIIEELHKIREEIAAESNYDMHAIVVALRRRQQAENRPVISLPPKRVADIADIAARVSDLIHCEKTGGLSPTETAELDDYLTLEHLGRLARARLRLGELAATETPAIAEAETVRRAA